MVVEGMILPHRDSIDQEGLSFDENESFGVFFLI
jgi:hypothetical protein